MVWASDIARSNILGDVVIVLSDRAPSIRLRLEPLRAIRDVRAVGGLPAPAVAGPQLDLHGRSLHEGQRWHPQGRALSGDGDLRLARVEPFVEHDPQLAIGRQCRGRGAETGARGV